MPPGPLKITGSILEVDKFSGPLAHLCKFCVRTSDTSPRPIRALTPVPPGSRFLSLFSISS